MRWGAASVVAFTLSSPVVAWADEPIVHLDAHDPAVLERQLPGDARWEQVCRAPCDMRLSTTDSYRVSGPSISTSKPFEILRPGAGRATLLLKPAYRTGIGGGIFLTVAGPFMTLIGIFVGVAGTNNPTPFDCPSCGGSNDSHLIQAAGGFGAAILGMVVTVAGIYSIVRASSSTVQQIDPNVLRAQAAQRGPAWRDEKRVVTALPIAPIVDLAF